MTLNVNIFLNFLNLNLSIFFYFNFLFPLLALIEKRRIQRKIRCRQTNQKRGKKIDKTNGAFRTRDSIAGVK